MRSILNKSTYAGNEESDLLQKYYSERQRVQELEEELDRVHKTSKNALEIGSDQTLKFKQLVGILRKKYDEAQQRNNELREKFDKFLLEHDKLKKSFEQTTQEQKQKDLQLKNTIADLETAKEKLEEIQVDTQDKEEELQSLKEQLIKLKEILHAKELSDQNSKTEIETYKQKQRQFERVVHYLRKRLEEAHLENKELFESYQNSLQVNKQQEAALGESMSSAAALKDELEKANARLQEIANYENNEKAAQREFFDDQLKILISSKNELEQIKCSVVQNLQEFKQEKSKSEEAYLKRMEQLEKELAEANQERQLISRELLDLKKKDAEQQQEIDAKKQQLASLGEELSKQNIAGNEVKERLNFLEANKEEAETALRMAQQHLAKKMRETTVVAEENEELKQQIRSLQNELDIHKLKVEEYQNAIDLEQQNQRRLHDQYQEGLKAFEVHTLKWEEKYFGMQQQWQEADARLREYKNFEEKYQKMHSILNHLSNLLGKPIVLPAFELSHSFDAITIEKEKNLQIDQPTLFDLPLFSKEVKSFYS